MTYMLIVLLRSTAMIMSLRIVLLSTFFYGYIMCAALLAGENPAIKIENFTTIYYHKYTGKGYLDSNLPRRLDFGVKQSKGEVYEAVGLNITYTKDFNFVRTHQLLGPENAARNFYVGYPPLRSDDIIPAYGRLYFVTVKCLYPVMKLTPWSSIGLVSTNETWA